MEKLFRLPLLMSLTITLSVRGRQFEGVLHLELLTGTSMTSLSSSLEMYSAEQGDVSLAPVHSDARVSMAVDSTAELVERSVCAAALAS